MTGYGRAQVQLPDGKMTIEIRSVNGKGADISIKTSLLPKDKEMELRKRLSDTLQRGSIDLFVTWEPSGGGAQRAIDETLALQYASQIRRIGSGMGITGEIPGLVEAVLSMPGVVDTSRSDVVNGDNWPSVERGIDEAISAICEYRAKEGEALQRDVCSRVRRILAIVDEVESFEAERLEAVRSRLLNGLEELKAKYDESRFEQEMVYYIEKLDINEEKVRLRQHCKYFLDTVDSDPCPGKKLGFIIQEMGREINTIGSKANYVPIQKCVVRMKDELEKVREQSMNIL